jgi:hypothetical protein
MKKITLLFLILLAGYGTAFTQDQPTFASEWQEDLAGFQRTGMIVLGSWAVGNIAAGGIGMTQTQGVPYYFHQMNLFWNTVNLGIAVGGYIGATSMDPAVGSVEVLNQYHQFSKILLLNTGLDVGYVMTGLYLRERSGNVSRHAKRLKGYGNSLMLQGGFLLVFDLVLALINEQAIQEMISSGSLQVGMTPAGVGLSLSF